MKKILNGLIIFCLSFGIGYFAAIDLDKNFRHRRLVNEIMKQTKNGIELFLD